MILVTLTTCVSPLLILFLFRTQGIQIQSVVVMSVSLPDDIQEQMKDKTMMISARAQQVMYHNEAMQSTRMEEEIRTKQQGFEEEQQEETIIGQEQINKEQMKLNDAVAEAAKADADIREETRVYLEKIEAQNAFEIQRITDSGVSVHLISLYLRLKYVDLNRHNLCNP